jgi:hypothetical protein
MNCQSFQDLSFDEKLINVGELIHLYQNDEDCHKAFNSILRSARVSGLFEGVTFLPFIPQPALETENETV